MRDFLRPLAGVLGIACFATGLTALSTGCALAQAKQAPPSQMAAAQAAPPPYEADGADRQADSMACLPRRRTSMRLPRRLPHNNAPPSPKAVAQLDTVAKKNGFASYDQYNDVVDNITLVLSCFDPVSKKYVGFDAATKAQIAQVQANKQMSAKDKKDALTELNELR